MPRRIRWKGPKLPADKARPERWLAVAGGYAAAELGLGLAAGFFTLGRAEPLLFLFFRPWLLVVLAAALAGATLRLRLGAGCAALLLAAAAETILIVMLGARGVATEALYGLAGGFLVYVLADLLVQGARRLVARFGRFLGAAAALALLASPLGMPLYEAVVLRPAAPDTRLERPPLMVMTGLPIIWGEGGAFDPASRPALAYRALGEAFALQPLDTLTPETLGTGDLLLLAQPRLLAPAELAALDAWVRGGGKAVILTDPMLAWPSALPLDDPQRPPSIGLLGPLLDHWGLRLEPGVSSGLKERQVIVQGERRRLVMESPGRLAGTGGVCAVEESWLARCRIGAGEAIVLADADLLRDDLWAPIGPARHQRIADNPWLIADWLDLLDGSARQRAEVRVSWIAHDASRTFALAAAWAPILAALALALILRLKRRA